MNINNQPEKAFKVTVSHDNLGQSSTGYARYQAGLKLENILAINTVNQIIAAGANKKDRVIIFQQV
nr:ShlB/FhaC/HecB family hemolysin secretion/activation protein [Bartonella mastomydis]